MFFLFLYSSYDERIRNCIVVTEDSLEVDPNTILLLSCSVILFVPTIVHLGLGRSTKKNEDKVADRRSTELQEEDQ